jgi:two-component system, chemotaxis family, chemotaxis protein CheY
MAYALDKTLLIVDDSVSSRRLIRRYVEPLGVQVVGEAANGEEAVKLFRDLRPSLVTLDIVLPVMDGITAARICKTLDPFARMIMCSSVSSRERAQAAKVAGACDFILKPIVEARLREAVARLIGYPRASRPLMGAAFAGIMS